MYFLISVTSQFAILHGTFCTGVRRYSIVATCIFRHNEGFDTKKFIRHIQSDMKTECMTFPLRLKWKNTWSSFFIIFQHKSHQGHQEKRTAISRN